jgi:hypothetical protein
MLETSSQRVGELLAKWEAGDQEALRALTPLIYNELRRLAHHYLRRRVRITRSRGLLWCMRLIFAWQSTAQPTLRTVATSLLFPLC